MAHLVFPDGLTAEQNLLIAVNTKHTTDGDKSILTVYLTQNGIDLDKAELIATQVVSMDATRGLMHNQSCNYTQLRDLSFDPVISRMKGEVQYLKSIYKTNPKELVNWNINVEGTGKIVYPAHFEDLNATAAGFFAKHLSYPAGTSPLTAYLIQNSIDLVADNAALATATLYHDKSKGAAATAESLTQQRNILWHPYVGHLKGIGNYLLKYYGANTKGPGDYGYIVDNSVAKPKMVVSKIMILSKITLKGLVLGGTVTNNGLEDAHLYKGKTTTGNPIIILPGAKYTIPKGYSVITISNPSATNQSVIKALRLGQSK